MNAAAFDPALLGLPFLAGLVVLATHVPLGKRVLARGIVFLDLAIAQFAGLGVIAAHALELAPVWAVQATAFSAALAGAALLAWSDRRWPARQEALIGSSFVVVASLAALLVAHDPHGGEALRDLLIGQILWVGPAQLAASIGLYALVALLWRPLAKREAGFYAIFALAITASVQLVGVYLVFASLILPALAASGLVRGGTALAFITGAAGYGIGLALSAYTDWPTGPLVVVSLAVCALAAGLAARLAARKAQR